MPAKGQLANVEHYKARVKKIHKGHITIIGEYLGSKQPIKARCKNGHTWTPIAQYLTMGQGCRKCGHIRTINSVRLTHDEYVKRITNKFSGQIKVIGTYSKQTVNLKHECSIHGVFENTPDSMMNKLKYGCPECTKIGKGINRKKSNNEVIAQIFAKHGTRVKLIEPYSGSRVPHKFKCEKGHTWKTTPDSVIRISGCPTCNDPLRFSKVAIKWIKKYCKANSLGKAQHALNGGEVWLYGSSGQRYKVDGFLHKHNLVLEFNGDCFHGNPAKFKPTDKPNPYSNLTAKELYKNTKRKAKDLTNAGYKVVSVWESDFKSGKLVSSVTVPAYYSATTDDIMTWNN